MTVWDVNGIPQHPNWLDLEPVRVLYEFDGPRIFICKDVPGEPYLAYLCGEDRDGVRYLVVQFSDALERGLTTGEINLRDALARPRAWVFDLDNDWRATRCWKVNIDDLPPGVLPKPGVMLWPELRPVVNNAAFRPATAGTELVYDTPPRGRFINIVKCEYA